MGLSQLLDFLRRRWWILALATLGVAGSAYYISSNLTPIFSATTTILVNQTQQPGVVQYNDVLTSERLTSTYAQLVERRPILTEVVRRLSLLVGPEALAAKIEILPIRNTQLLRISVRDPDPKLAARIANTTAQVFIDDNAGQLANRPGTVSIAEEAPVPSQPTEPNVRLNTVLAAVLGLLLGGAVALFLDYLDDTVKTSQDVEALSGLTVLGVVSRFRSGGNGKAARPPGPGVEPAEDYRQIRTNIHFSLFGPGSKVILVTSSNPAEGKSTTAANLGAVLAQAGHRVILVDTDLRRPSLHRHFGTPNTLGLTGLLLSGSTSIETALTNVGIPGLRLLPSGPLPPNPSEILMSPEVHDILQRIRNVADYVILDSPPVLAVTDARILAGLSDATVVVVEPGKTRSEAYQRAFEALQQTNAKIMGVILNKVKRRRRSGYYYYGYSPPAEAAGTRSEPRGDVAA